MFHLGWFVGSGYGPQHLPQGASREQWAKTATDWTRGDFYIDIAKKLEEACFDCVVFEDGLMIPDAYQGSMDTYLRYALEGPRNDPTALTAILGHATSRIGILPTMSTSFYPPFMAARMMATLDHVSRGRFGANLVTSSSHRAAQNFGLEKHIDHDLRYEMAGEWVELVNQLLGSWEPGAIVSDPETGVFADHTKVHTIDFDGRFHKSRGPLNTPPGPQGRPVYCQAGGSPAGRAFAARHADMIMCVPLGIEAMKHYRDDISAQMIAAGRKPSDCKVMYLIRPIVAETDSAARDLFESLKAARRSDAFVQCMLAVMSYFSGTDFSKFDLDEPMPDLTGKVNGHQSSMSRYAKDGAATKSLRDLVIGQDIVASIELVGSPDTVARIMGQAMEYVGGDGYCIANDVDAASVESITDGLIPALKKRGLTRSHYEFEHFKDNLRAF